MSFETLSYLFIGPDGIGKSLFAKEFAKMILCYSEKKPCTNCKSCIEFDNNNNPDFIEILPEDGTIKIEKIRQMNNKVLEKPIISKNKVYLIKDADYMTKEAQNSLLKTLEEPPKYVTIIMTCANESMILNTIKSRCMKIQFNKIEDSIIKSLLEKKRYNITESLLKAYDGSFKNINLINENQELYDEIYEVFSNKEKYTLLEVINKLEFLYKSKDIIFELLDYINIILADNILQRQENIKYIEIVEQTKRNLNANCNFDMSIDNMLYKIWEE